MNEKKPLKMVALDNLVVEEGAEEILSSPEMQPYLRYVEALLAGRELQPALEDIRQLPLEKRYVWRIASALKWGFADFDNVNVAVDQATLLPRELAKVIELLKHRPIQFCIFVKALLGAEEMERLMMQGVAVAKEQD